MRTYPVHYAVERPTRFTRSWSIRLLAYQASLVDEYPPFSFHDAPPPQLPAARISA